MKTPWILIYNLTNTHITSWLPLRSWYPSPWWSSLLLASLNYRPSLTQLILPCSILPSLPILMLPILPCSILRSLLILTQLILPSRIPPSLPILTLPTPGSLLTVQGSTEPSPAHLETLPVRRTTRPQAVGNEGDGAWSLLNYNRNWSP